MSEPELKPEDVGGRKANLVIRGAAAELRDILWGEFPEKRVVEVLLEGCAGGGKSRSITYLLGALCSRFPGIRILVLRATRASLTESFCQPLEDDIFPGSWPPMDKSSRREYRFQKGTFVLGSLENASRLYSTNYDVVYVQEAFELTEDEWIQNFRALRKWTLGMRFQLLIGDTNPDSKEHWLNVRFNEQPSVDDKGATILRYRLKSQLEDNPKFWALGPTGMISDGHWTEEGSAYVGALDSMPEGPRKQRLRYGQWTSAQGAIFPEWGNDCRVHELPAMRWYAAGCDWGYTDPGVLMVFGVDVDGVCYCVRQVYMTRQGPDYWAEKIADAYRDYRVRFVAADPSRPEHLAKANERLSYEFGVAATGTPRVVREAENEWFAGIETMRGMMASGKLKFWRNALVETDQDLRKRKLPTSFESEIPDYCYATSKHSRADGGRVEKEAPGSWAHAIDATRYFCMTAWRMGNSDAPAPTKHADVFEKRLRSVLKGRYDEYAAGQVIAGPPRLPIRVGARRPRAAAPPYTGEAAMGPLRD